MHESMPLLFDLGMFVHVMEQKCWWRQIKLDIKYTDFKSHMMEWLDKECQTNRIPNYSNPDSKVDGANMGPTWVLSAPDGLNVGPMSLAIWEHMHAI